MRPVSNVFDLNAKMGVWMLHQDPLFEAVQYLARWHLTSTVLPFRQEEPSAGVVSDRGLPHGVCVVEFSEQTGDGVEW